MKSTRSILILCFIIFHSGNILAQNQEILIPYRINDQWGFSSYSKEIVIPISYDSVTVFSDYNYLEKPIATVYINKLCGIINTNNKPIIPILYNSIEKPSGMIQYNSNRLIVSKNGKYGLIDYSNKVIIPIEYDTLMAKDNINIEGYDYLASKENSGYLFNENGKGKLLEKKEYKKKESIRMALAWPDQEEENVPEPPEIKLNSELIEKNKTNLDSIGIRTFGYKEDLVEIYLSDKVGVCSKQDLETGNLTDFISPIYDEVVDVFIDWDKKPTFFLMRRSGKLTIVDLKGKEYITPKYSEYETWTKYYFKPKEGDKVGYINLKENFEIPPIYESIKPIRTFNIDIYKVTYNGQIGYVNQYNVQYFENN